MTDEPNASRLDVLESNAEIRKHRDEVRRLLWQVVVELLARGEWHDQSKLESPEAEVFAAFSRNINGLTYDSEEYRACLAAMKPGLDHHYAANRHHPEHFENGVNEMTLVDVVEMLCDWKAATKRHADGDIRQSIEINRHRFGLSDQLVNILSNTVNAMGWQ